MPTGSRQWRGDFQTPVAVARGRAHRPEQDAVRCPAARCTAPRAYLSLAHDPNQAARARPHFRVRVPLHRGTGRQAVRRTVRGAFDLLCAQGQLWLPLPRPFPSNWWRARSWSAIPATNTSAPMTTSAATNACRSSCSRNWSKRSATEREAWQVGSVPPLPELMVLGELAQTAADGSSDVGPRRGRPCARQPVCRSRLGTSAQSR